MKDLAVLAYELREDVVDMIVEGGAGHIGGYECDGDSDRVIF